MANQQSRTAVKSELDRLTAEFFRAVSFEAGEIPPFENIYALFIESGLLIKNVGATPEVCSLRQFIEPRQAMLNSGELTRFREEELSETTQIFGNVAHRFFVVARDGPWSRVNLNVR
jgi:hypothetical protein